MRIKQTDIFKSWLKKLKDRSAKARIELRIRRIELSGNLGDYKPVGEGVYELRIDYGAGYRVYFTRQGSELLLLLVGGDKSSQKRDIIKAQRILQELKKEDHHG